MTSRFGTFALFASLVSALPGAASFNAAAAEIGFSGHVQSAPAILAVAVRGRLAALPAPDASEILSVTDEEGRPQDFGVLRHEAGLAAVVRLRREFGERFVVCAAAGRCVVYRIHRLD